ncbi:MAG TPA: hypothetical protein DCS43_03935 [Verrucomicrobia bacterium]|nr:hypothetical protein [Verrucomicrobiota bacterium]
MCSTAAHSISKGLPCGKLSSTAWKILATTCLFLLFLLPAFAIPADFEQACKVAESIARNGQTNAVELWGLPTLHVAGRTTLTTWGHQEIAAPWPSCWVFFIDDDPAANWAHPCRYVFIAPDLSSTHVIDAVRPLTIEGPDAVAGPYGMERLIAFHPAAIKFAPVVIASGSTNSILYGEADSHHFALLISGGNTTNSNTDRYWRDTAYIYSTLIQKYGYAKSNVTVLVADGTNPAIDHLNYNYVPPDSWLASTPLDFDGDGECDITGDASAASVSNAFLDLQSRLTPQDQLFVFLTDHGGPTPGGSAWDVELSLWNQERLHDRDLQALTEPISCPIFFVMEQCYGGGFADDLDQSNRAIATAAAHNGTSYAMSYPFYYDQWSYYWTAAVRGFFPSNNVPWVDGAPCNADFNGDGYVSFREASFFATANKAENEHPTYQEVPDFLGCQSFLARVPTNVPSTQSLERLTLHGIHTPEVENRPVPFQIVARNPFGNPLTTFSSPVHVETEVDDIIDPGLYSGTTTDMWWSYPFNIQYDDVRMQVIYPASQFGGARTFSEFQLTQTCYPTLVENFTIRMKHTSLDAYPSNAVFESEGWTTVFHGDTTIDEEGWIAYPFSSPFEYNGIDNLMVDFSFDNSTNYPRWANSYAGASTAPCTLIGTSTNEHGSPLEWSATNGPTPELSTTFPIFRIGPAAYGATVSVTPSNITEFVDGVWSGNLLFQGTAKRMRLRVTVDSNAYWTAIAPDFAVRDYPFVQAPPQLAANGNVRLQWSSGTGQTYRVMTATNLLAPFSPVASNIPATPPLNVYTAAPDASPSTFFSIHEE